MSNTTYTFPPQQLPYSKKTKEWRRKCIDWAADRTYSNYSLVRKSVRHKKINYDLLEGEIHIEDFEKLIHYDRKSIGYIPENIQHYPIISPKLNLLKGEESKRVFDCKVIVTNPNAVTDIERRKRDAIRQQYEAFLQGAEQDQQKDEEQLKQIQRYFTYEWQDFREQEANKILNHYNKELNMPALFNEGFMDALAVGEEIYQCDIIGGEPIIRRLNPMKVHIFRNGFSNKIEDADIIIIEDYWSPGVIHDTFYDALSQKDREYIEDISSKESDVDGGESVRDTNTRFYNVDFIGEDGIAVKGYNPMSLADSDVIDHLSPFDMSGNIRVVQVYWKSRKKIKKVKSYDEITGEEVYNYFPEDHIIDESKGEEEEIFWVNEAWEGTKIGEKVYVNVRPRPVQYCRLSNPSKCHFGIIGSIYNLNEGKPYSAVDMMKPYNYMYDVVHDRLNKAMARNWGKSVELDLAKKPANLTIEEWLYYLRDEQVYIKNSFNEGNVGAATGKLAGALNNNSTGIIDLDTSATIRGYIECLQFIMQEMSEVFGVSPQREGAISNRETVGGVERATVQSAHITEWLFVIHNDVKRRAYNCFIETAKEAKRGGSIKFEYICSDGSQKLVDIDGDAFAECDYGIVVDASDGAQKLQQQIETLAQAALQNQALDFSTIMKLYNSCSLAEKQHLVEKSEQDIKAQQQQAMQMQQQQAQQAAQAQMQAAQMKMQQDLQIARENNETRIRVAEIEAQTKYATTQIQDPEQFNRELEEKKREFDEKLDLEERKFQADNSNAQKADQQASKDRQADLAKSNADRMQNEMQFVRSEQNKMQLAKMNKQDKKGGK